MKTKSQRRTRPNLSYEDQLMEQIDELEEFEEFKKLIHPIARKMIRNKSTPEQIYKAFANIAAARAVTIAMSEGEAHKALNAIKEVLDRSKGKATEKKEVEHRFKDLNDHELESLIASKLKESALDDEDESLPN